MDPMQNRLPPPNETTLNVAALSKAATGERYVILFDDRNKSLAIETVARWACHPDLSFDLADGERLARKIEELCE